MLTTGQAIKEARYAMVNGNLVRKPIPARVVDQWLDVIKDTLLSGSGPGTSVDIWCDGWYKHRNPPGLRMGYSFRPVINGVALCTHRDTLPKSTKRSSMIAEYAAIIHALRWVTKQNFRGNITIHTDCQTAWGQLTRGWQVRAYKYPEVGRLWSWANQLLKETDAQLVKEPRKFVEALLGH